MKENSKDRSVTIRINKDVYQKLVDETLERSVKEGRIIKISEIIREKFPKFAIHLSKTNTNPVNYF